MTKENLLNFLKLQEKDLQDAIGEVEWIKSILQRDSHALLLEKLEKQLLSDDEEVDLHLEASGVAMHAQAFYTGVELFLKNVMRKTDGSIPDGDSWHSRLLKQASRATEGRAPIISKPTFEDLGMLRGFRHVVRNIYGTPLDPKRSFEIGEMAKSAAEGLTRDWGRFMDTVTRPSQEEEKRTENRSSPGGFGRK